MGGGDNISLRNRLEALGIHGDVGPSFDGARHVVPVDVVSDTRALVGYPRGPVYMAQGIVGGQAGPPAEGGAISIQVRSPGGLTIKYLRMEAEGGSQILGGRFNVPIPALRTQVRSLWADSSSGPGITQMRGQNISGEGARETVSLCEHFNTQATDYVEIAHSDQFTTLIYRDLYLAPGRTMSWKAAGNAASFNLLVVIVVQEHFGPKAAPLVSTA